jgi:hypothetical protein
MKLHLEPDRLSRIQLLDKTSRLHPRHVESKHAALMNPKAELSMRRNVGDNLATTGRHSASIEALSGRPVAEPNSHQRYRDWPHERIRRDAGAKGRSC